MKRKIRKPMAIKVMELLHLPIVVELRVENYQQMTEKEKRQVCQDLWDITICKIPARKGHDMLFYLTEDVQQ